MTAKLTPGETKTISNRLKYGRKSIDQAIEDCNGFILVLTPKALDSPWVAYEWTLAYWLKKPIIQIEFERININDCHPRLSERQSIDFTDQERHSVWVTIVNFLKEIESQPKISDGVRRAREQLSDSNSASRIQGIEFLRMSPDPSSVDTLIEVVEDRQNQYLRALRFDAAFALTQKTQSKGKSSYAIPLLKQGLGELNSEISHKCAQILGSIGIDAAVEALIEGFHSESREQVRIDIITALGVSKNPLALPFLQSQEVLSSNQWRVVQAAVYSLGQIGGPDLVPRIYDILQTHPSNEVKIVAVKALAMIGGVEAIAKLFDVFRDEELSSQARAEALNGLGEIGDSSTLEKLRPCRNWGPYSAYRQHIENSIRRIENRLNDSE